METTKDPRESERTQDSPKEFERIWEKTRENTEKYE